MENWSRIDTGLTLDWQIGCRPESSWLRIVLVPLTGVCNSDWSGIGTTIVNRVPMGMI